MATSFWLPLASKAFAAAPPPRPPQPIRAIWMVSEPAAWTCGMETPARAETAATLPVVLRKSRREVTRGSDSFIIHLPDATEGAAIRKNHIGARVSPPASSPELVDGIPPFPVWHHQSTLLRVGTPARRSWSFAKVLDAMEGFGSKLECAL